MSDALYDGLSEGYKRGINQNADDPMFHQYDCYIQMRVDQINAHLEVVTAQRAATENLRKFNQHDLKRTIYGNVAYQNLDWRIIKAMMWTETALNKNKWEENLMRIGAHPKDRGMAEVLRHRAEKESPAGLILPQNWKNVLTSESAIQCDPRCNIMAGIGYLIICMFESNLFDVPENGTMPYKLAVTREKNYGEIAKNEKSTINIIRILNPKSKPERMRSGDVLWCQKGSIKRMIQRWFPVEPEIIAKTYNQGDPNYKTKMEFNLNEYIYKTPSPSCTDFEKRFYSKKPTPPLACERKS